MDLLKVRVDHAYSNLNLETDLLGYVIGNLKSNCHEFKKVNLNAHELKNTKRHSHEIKNMETNFL